MEGFLSFVGNSTKVSSGFNKAVPEPAPSHTRFLKNNYYRLEHEFFTQCILNQLWTEYKAADFSRSGYGRPALIY
jgi:hypothetical protein